MGGLKLEPSTKSTSWKFNFAVNFCYGINYEFFGVTYLCFGCVLLLHIFANFKF